MRATQSTTAANTDARPDTISAANTEPSPCNPSGRPLATGCWTRHQLRACLMALVPLLALMLCGAVPAEKGTEITLGSGYNDQHVSYGCSAYRVRSVPVYAMVRRQADNGLSMTASTTLLQGIDGDSGLIDGDATVRLGYHGKNAGIELGPRLMFTTDGGLRPEMMSWSGEAWMGEREHLYGYLRSFSGPSSPDLETDMGAVGLGHQSSNVRMEVEIPWYTIVNPARGLSSPTVRTQLKVVPDVWLGLDAGLQRNPDDQDSPDKRMLVTLTLQP